MWQEDVVEDGEGVDGDEHREWEASILRCPMDSEPDRALKDKSWNPIFHFPLSNVHFCIFHAFMRIFDKLLKLHIDYAFTMKPLSNSTEAINKVEELLNSIGCHSGNVSIVLAKKMGEAHDIAQQVSMSSRKARRFFKK